MNIDINQFHFLRPLFLLLFVLLAWFVWRIYQHSKNANAWSKACDPGLLSYLLIGVEKKKGWFHLFLLSVVGSLLIFAMAGPTWSKLPQAVYKNESARIFVLDMSRSMDATDLSPTRASRAKLKLIDFLEDNHEGQAALIVYADHPHIVSPLTDDSNTIISMIPSLSTAIMPTGGGRADLAILKAAQLLKQAGNTGGDIVLLTDGINLDAALDSAEEIMSAGFRLHVIGVGTEQGSPIPTAGGYLKDSRGSIVIPKINRSELKSLALAGAGVYSDITVNNTDIERLHKMDINKELNKDNPFVREVDLWRDQGHLFLLLALPFAALGFRRGWLGTVLVLSIMVPPQDAYALSWEDLWVNKNQQAQKELNEGNAKDASELFENPQWKGVAQYKNGDFEKAGEQFLKSDTAESYYNLGNSLARQGKFKEAIDAYNNTLERDPKHKDAEFNKTLVQKLIDEQESDQEQKSDENKDSDKDSDEKSDQKDKNKSESDQKESDQSQDSQDADQKEAQDKESQDKEKQKKEEQKKEEQQQNKTDEQKEAEKSEEQKAQEQKEIEDNKTPEQKEIEQATEQWLRRIPDDPGGLLREKMRRQNIRDRQRQRPTTENQW